MRTIVVRVGCCNLNPDESCLKARMKPENDRSGKVLRRGTGTRGGSTAYVTVFGVFNVPWLLGA